MSALKQLKFQSKHHLYVSILTPLYCYMITLHTKENMTSITTNVILESSAEENTRGVIFIAPFLFIPQGGRRSKHHVLPHVSQTYRMKEV